ncbi:MAG: hypothetical protein A2687_01570 [Candidatus Levybacteria bacterium RIFCSPHIGHO2_01_FULL_38_26]|nr:MAG: hypothetical protein A2687_01570 [Candidatus Levybacteria bacterium RIFCSPHIGHO2_01_FULL_38_26]
MGGNIENELSGRMGGEYRVPRNLERLMEGHFAFQDLLKDPSTLESLGYTQRQIEFVQSAVNLIQPPNPNLTNRGYENWFNFEPREYLGIHEQSIIEASEPGLYTLRCFKSVGPFSLSFNREEELQYVREHGLEDVDEVFGRGSKVFNYHVLNIMLINPKIISLDSNNDLAKLTRKGRPESNSLKKKSFNPVTKLLYKHNFADYYSSKWTDEAKNELEIRLENVEKGISVEKWRKLPMLPSSDFHQDPLLPIGQVANVDVL